MSMNPGTTFTYAWVHTVHCVLYRNPSNAAADEQTWHLWGEFRTEAQARDTVAALAAAARTDVE